MYAGRWAAAAALATVFALAALCPAQRDASQRLDDHKLGESLKKMGMTELAEELDQRMAARTGTPQAKIDEAMKASDLQQRDRLLHAAIAQIERQVEVAKPKDEFEQLDLFKLRFAMLSAMVARAEPYAQRLLYLQGGPADRRSLVDLTEKAAVLTYVLREEIRDQVQNWRMDLAKVMTVVPPMTELQGQAKYGSAWLLFYRAMGLQDRKVGLLNDAMAAAHEFAEGDEESGVKHWSELLIGMCFRELGESSRPDQVDASFKQAVGYFKQAIAAPAGENQASPKLQASFELAKTYIAWGKFDEARKAVDAYVQETSAAAGKVNPAGIDLAKTLLLNRLYETNASLKGLPVVEAAVHRKAAQQVLLDFADKYRQPEIRADFFRIIAGKYAERTDYENLAPIVLMAIASYEQAEAERARKGGQAQAAEEATAKALKLAEMVLAADDDLSKQLHPMAQEILAHAAFLGDDKIKAVRQWIELAKSSPDGKTALTSALNAVRACSKIMQERRSQNRPAEDVRPLFVNALEILLGKPAWRSDPKVTAWWYDLGWQYQLAAEMSADQKAKSELMVKAVDAYKHVATDSPNYLEATGLCLELESHLMESYSGGDVQTRATDLAGRLRDFAKAAHAAAEAAQKAGDQDTARHRSNSGARAEFRAAEILYDKLDQKALAMQVIQSLPQKWPGSNVLRDSAAFEIRKLLEEGQRDETKLAQAIAKLEEFTAKHTEQAQGMVQFVVRQRRDAIKTLRQNPSREAELKAARQTYLKFATILLERASSSAKATPGELQRARQLVADAMLENGQAQEALDLFKQTYEYEQAQLDKTRQEIDNQFGDMRKELAEAGDSASRVEEVVNGFFNALKQAGLAVEAMSESRRLKQAWDYYQKPGARTGAEVKERLDVLKEKLGLAIDALADLLKKSQAMDLDNLLGLARANCELRNGEESLKYYGIIASTLNKSQHPALYWEMQLERCQAALDLYRGDGQMMDSLVSLIRQLRYADVTMGGLYVNFAEIERKAAAVVQGSS